VAHLAIAEPLEEAEVDEADPAVVEEQRVARVRVAVEQAVAQRAVDVEAAQDLAEPVALRLRPVLDGGEPLALDELRHDHALAAQRHDDVGHDHERVAAVHARHVAVVGRLELVVELLGDALADLVGDRPGVDAGSDR
jgi:hypothetical protein